MDSRCFASAFACLIACSCAPETHARPPPVVAPASALPMPLPETAFQSDSEPAPRRFETRRIGEGDRPEGKRFHGASVDLDLKGADLQDVFRLLADVGHVNIVVGGEVSGTITLRLRRVPWDQALDVIARAKGLVLERDGNMILVRPRS